MPDLLGVTNPVSGLDNANINQNLLNVPNDPRLQNAPDLERVSRPDNRTEQQDSGDAATSQRLLRYDSNFFTFLQRLSDTPDLVESMNQLLRSWQGTVVASGMGEGMALDMASLLQMLKMEDGQQLHTFFKDQMNTGSRFTGPLFNILREAYGNTNSEVLRGSILQFLKRYSDYSSTPHIQGNLLRTLTRLTRSIPASFGNQVLPMAAELEGRLNNGDRPGALKLLQNTILPFLANYTSRTNDMGISRTLISMLALDVARYENSSEEGLLQSFHQLKAHTAIRERVGDLKDDALLKLLMNSAPAKTPEKTQFADQLVKTAQRALRGGSGAEAQSSFRNIVSAFLINQSVYMDLNHIIIPLEWNDRLMFSELWVDPDEEENLKKGKGRKDNTIRFLFKMDIQDLGFFDMVMACQGESVDLQLFCPQAVAPFSSIVQTELTRILSENGLSPNGIQVQLMEKPLTISSVFPKIFQGGSGIDVKA